MKTYRIKREYDNDMRVTVADDVKFDPLYESNCGIRFVKESGKYDQETIAVIHNVFAIYEEGTNDVVFERLERDLSSQKHSTSVAVEPVEFVEKWVRL